MPKIKRSVDYTFEAYSGDHDQETENMQSKLSDSNNSNNFESVNDESDDESSKL